MRGMKEIATVAHGHLSLFPQQAALIRQIGCGVGGALRCHCLEKDSVVVLRRVNSLGTLQADTVH